jgi:hypothetical protein
MKRIRLIHIDQLCENIRSNALQLTSILYLFFTISFYELIIFKIPPKVKYKHNFQLQFKH